MKRFGILFNPKLSEARKVSRDVARALALKEVSVYLDSYRGKKDRYIKVVSRKEVLTKSDLIFAIGGDGTILKIAREIGKNKTPILGVNAGNLGFLAELRKSDVPSSIENILSGKFEIEKRERLCIDILKGKRIIKSFLSLNDVVIQNNEIARVIHISISIGKECLTDFLADGVIASTPTGSTAYSLSANGPIVFPENASFVITPICPHTLSNRPFVIPDHKVLTLSVVEGKAPVVTIDGQINHSLKYNEYVRVTKSKYPIYFLKTSDVSYIQVLKEKLGWKGTCLP